MKKPPRTVEASNERRKPARRPTGLGRLLGSPAPAPTREEAHQRIRSKPGFFESLTQEARSTIERYDGPEALGPSNSQD